MDDILNSSSSAASNSKADGDEFLIPLQTPEQFAKTTAQANQKMADSKDSTTSDGSKASSSSATGGDSQQEPHDAKPAEQGSHNKLLLDFDPLSSTSTAPVVTTPSSYHGGSDWLSDFTGASASSASR